MTTLPSLTVTLPNGKTARGKVVYIQPKGEGKAEVHIESNFHIEIGRAHPAMYATPSHEAKGTFVANSNEFTERMTYIKAHSSAYNPMTQPFCRCAASFSSAQLGKVPQVI